MTNPAQPQPQQTAKNSKYAEAFVGPKRLGDQDPGPGPRTGSFTAPSERRLLLSGADRRRFFVWVHQTLATARQKGRGQRGHAGRRGETWGWGSASGAHLLSDTLPLPFCAGVIRSPSFRALIQPRGSALARRTPTAQ